LLGGYIFQQTTVGIPMRTNWDPIPVDFSRNTNRI